MERGDGTMQDQILQVDENMLETRLDRLVSEKVEQLLNAEADEITGAARYERTGDRKAYRVGHYERDLTVKAGCLCSISCCGFSHDDFSGLGRACRPRNGLNWMVLVSPPERTGKDYDQHAPSTVYPSFAAERGIRRVDRAENTCQRADGA
jgi:transposase, mutator family